MKAIIEKLTRIVLKTLHITMYYLLYHRRTITKLSAYGFSDISTHQVRRWLRIIRGEFLIRFYYFAKLNGEPCFIKIAKRDHTLKNEIYVNKYLIAHGATFMPRLLISDVDFDKDRTMLAFEAISDMREFEMPDNVTTFESVCKDFEDIFNFFREHGIIHNDVNDSNLLLDLNNHIILIDFGIAKSPESDNSHFRNSVQRGLYYQSSADSRLYDDAYSFIRMLDDHNIPDVFRQNACYKRIEQLVGMHTHRITSSDFYNRGISN